MKRKDKREYTIQTVANAFRLLDEFHDAEELGVTELASRLGLHKNNVFRLLATLEQFGYIEQSRSTERYRLGVRSFELGRAYYRSRDLLRRARPVLQELARCTDESAHIAKLQGFDVVHLDGAVAPRLVQTGLRVGRRLPVHCTALGKVLLGCASPELRQAFDREVVWTGDGLGRRTDATIVDRDKFFEHLRTVAVGRFALDLEECEPGLSCAAAPVFDSEGEVVAAISVSGPAFRLDESRLLQEVRPLAVAAAERLSRELGYATG
jgi:DNA-binding IclR family transcriptional regulator